MPKGTETITSYANLAWYYKEFAAGKFNLLMVVGPPGLAKSELMKRRQGDKLFWIEGNVSAFNLYRTLYEQRDRRRLRVVLNDAECIWDRKGDGGAGVSLLKELCESNLDKTLSWQTQAAARAGLPQRFHLSCTVAVIANDWPPRSAHVEALEDRAHKLFFGPSAEEVHAYVGEWFEDDDVYNFVGERLHLIQQPSIRAFYLLAGEMKRAGPRPDGEDWRDYLLKRMELTGPELLVARLLSDARYPTMQARVNDFIEQGGGGRTTFFEYAARLRARARQGAPLQRAGLPD
jgi:hypothetical protein